MALKDWLDTGKCLLGFHEGTWNRETPQSCVLVQTCDRCRTISKQVEHDWPEWVYAADESCDLQRLCNRCREKEARIEHQWGNWVYQSEAGCEQGIQCTRCAAWASDSRIEHDWRNWEYNEQYRAPLHSCRRCSFLASYFPDQPIDQTEPESANSALAKVQELLTDDKAIEDMLKRAEAQSASAPTAVREAEPSGEDSAWREDGLKELRQMYEEQIKSGVIPPERRPLFNSILGELEEIVRSPAISLADKQIKAQRLQDARLRVLEAVLDPSRETAVNKPAAGTRLALIAQLHDELYRYVYRETLGVP